MVSFRQRLSHDEGFTLIELIVVMLIIAILLSIAIPSYLGFQKKAQQTAAMSDVRSAIPDAEAYFSDTNSYFGMTAATLKSTYDSGMIVQALAATPPVTDGIVSAIPSASDTQKYCISAVIAGHWAYVKGPGGSLTNATSSTSNPCTGF
jgi:type IV pilus assembly protein PilA